MQVANPFGPAGRPYGWWLYLAAMVAFLGLIFVTPFLEQAGSPAGSVLYESFHYFSHQLDSRSLCYFPRGPHSPIGDCTAQDGTFHPVRTPMPLRDGITGYKIPVCARCVGIYLFMLAGGLAWPLFFKSNSIRWPSIWILAIALAPVAIDGTTQLFGWRESNNSLRLLSGAIMGFALPFYIIPLFNGILSCLRRPGRADSGRSG